MFDESKLTIAQAMELFTALGWRRQAVRDLYVGTSWQGTLQYETVAELHEEARGTLLNLITEEDID